VRAPVVPLQVREQRNALFQLFQILTHGVYRSFQRQGTNLQLAFPGKDGGRGKKIPAILKPQGPRPEDS
jgi:hypothetical protein